MLLTLEPKATARSNKKPLREIPVQALTYHGKQDVRVERVADPALLQPEAWGGACQLSR